MSRTAQSTFTNSVQHFFKLWKLEFLSWVKKVVKKLPGTVENSLNHPHLNKVCLKWVLLLSCHLPTTYYLHLFCSGECFILVITIKGVLIWLLYHSFCFFLFSHSSSVLSISLRLVEPELVLSARHRGIFTFLVPFFFQNVFFNFNPIFLLSHLFCRFPWCLPE